MKTAVFKVSRDTAHTYLLAIEVASMGEAVSLEQALRRQLGPDCHVEFLGRFDQILRAPTMAEFLDIILEKQGEQTAEKVIALWPRSALVSSN